jgi:Uma2 family endonuclease
MAMPVLHTEWTVDMLDELPDDGNKYEIVDGELLVSPGPTRVHERCVGELFLLLSPYVERWEIGMCLGSNAQVVPNRRTAMKPDVSVIAVPPGGVDVHWRDGDRLLLAIEVLSPSTARYDRVKKRPAYLSMNAEYWIVDPYARLFERWVPGAQRPDVLDEHISWSPAGAGEPLTIDLPAYFDRVYRHFVPGSTSDA